VAEHGDLDLAGGDTLLDDDPLVVLERSGSPARSWPTSRAFDTPMDEPMLAGFTKIGNARPPSRAPMTSWARESGSTGPGRSARSPGRRSERCRPRHAVWAKPLASAICLAAILSIAMAEPSTPEPT
jgi:hypothetical protein